MYRILIEKNAQFIPDDAEPISDFSWSEKLVGIYFLMFAGNCVYTGMSEHALRRISEHQTNGLGGRFTEVMFEEFKPEDLVAWEKYYIALLSPPLNDIHIPKGKTPEEASLKRKQICSNHLSTAIVGDVFGHLFGKH